MVRAQARDPRGAWHTLERRRLGTQTFVPLCGVRYVDFIVVERKAAKVGCDLAELAEAVTSEWQS